MTYGAVVDTRRGKGLLPAPVGGQRVEIRANFRACVVMGFDGAQPALEETAPATRARRAAAGGARQGAIGAASWARKAPSTEERIARRCVTARHLAVRIPENASHERGSLTVKHFTLGHLCCELSVSNSWIRLRKPAAKWGELLRLFEA